MALCWERAHDCDRTSRYDGRQRLSWHKAFFLASLDLFRFHKVTDSLQQRTREHGNHELGGFARANSSVSTTGRTFKYAQYTLEGRP